MRPEEVFNLDFLLSTKRKSCSVGNFAVHLTRVLFTEEERRCSNVRGKKDKRQLNPLIMERVRELKMYPVTAPNRESRMKMEATVWSECIKAIDESGRRLARPKRAAMFEETIV